MTRTTFARLSFLVLGACSSTPGGTSSAAAGDECAGVGTAGGQGELQIPDAEEGKFNVAMVLIGPHDDGGWSQAKDMASDAWATGQALYALASAGLKADDPAIARGQAFLVKSQREDGSWPMTSRPTKPGGEGAKNLVPIIGAGSAWAVLGLVRSR